MARTTPATRALDSAGIPYDVIEYTMTSHEDGYGQAVVAATGQSPEQVFKTLMVVHERTLVAAMVPVAGKLDLKAVARALGVKNVQMAPQAQAERATGYKVGGISALGQRQPHHSLLDVSAMSFDKIYISGGQRGLELGLAPQDLVDAIHADIVEIARL